VVGLGAVYGICSGFVILSSFLWGVTAAPLWGDPPCTLVNPGLAVVGLFILIASVAGLAVFGSPDPGGDAIGAAKSPSGMASQVTSDVVNTESIVVTSLDGSESTVSSEVVVNHDSAVVVGAQSFGAPGKAAELETPDVSSKTSRRKEYIGMAFVALGGSLGGKCPALI
jgi:hypothetical protein